MKRLIALSLSLLLILTGCGNTAEPTDPLEGWLASANLDAEETPEQLYEAALGEGLLVIYSTTSRMFDVAKSFEAEYPGLTVHIEDIRENQLYDRLTENYNTGEFACDIIVSSDGRGILTNEFLPKTIAAKYTPYDISDKLLPETNDALLMFSGEAPMLGYNSACYETAPVGNWWELTEEKWRGMVYMPNPAKSATTLGFLSMMVKNSDMMAEAYEDLYGTPLVVPEGESAGLIFVRKLAENDLVLVNSSDEVCEEVGFPGSGSPSIGIFASSKIRMRDIGYELAINYDMEPFCGVYSAVSIMLAGGSENVNTAKLFVRWLLGETDGGGEGYEPYLHSGAWSVRSDAPDISGIRTDELNLLYLDRQYLYEHYGEMLAFWDNLLTEK